MKKSVIILAVLLMSITVTFAQSEAGAVWLLINPGARASGMGEVGVAIADDAYATFYNPAGLGFLTGRELSLTHTNWLPNLANDIYYEFLGYRHYMKNVGMFGGHIILLNLGEQERTDEYGNQLGTFTSFMMAMTGSYGTALSRTSSIGVNVKMVHQHLTDQGAGKEKGKGTSTNFAFDVGYMKRQFLLRNLTFGASIANIGPKIAFIDAAQADPMPTNLKLGLNYTFGGEYNRVTIAYDVNKLLVASYPDRDVDGDGLVGHYDENGHYTLAGEYNKDGQYEKAHTDDWYMGIFTSWVDDWLLLHDSAADGIGDEDEDGNTNDGSLKKELEKLTHNFGIEYWYSDLFAIRMGFIYDKTGNILVNDKWPVPTFGAGLRYAGLGFDFGYTAGDTGHPRQNTMLFSLDIKF
ncbi:MAG: PorV/PorQ family protein [Candidatus Marinimicrobia bacterium]|nr:PorV/PorQ family protein [Candidatus Neomarinimicrobiota bacterium]